MCGEKRGATCGRDGGRRSETRKKKGHLECGAWQLWPLWQVSHLRQTPLSPSIQEGVASRVGLGALGALGHPPSCGGGCGGGGPPPPPSPPPTRATIRLLAPSTLDPMWRAQAPRQLPSADWWERERVGHQRSSHTFHSSPHAEPHAKAAAAEASAAVEAVAVAAAAAAAVAVEVAAAPMLIENQ